MGPRHWYLKGEGKTCMPKGKQHFDDLIAYWRAMPKEGGLVPPKTAFSPMKVYKVLPSLFFSERLEKYNIRLRLMGEALEIASRSSLPGRNAFDTISRVNWDRVEAYYDALTTQPCGGHMARSMSLENGLVYDVESIVMPLNDSQGKPRFFIGLADLQHNRDKSVLAQQGDYDTDSCFVLGYFDLGYGVPKAQEDQLVKQVNKNG